MGIAGRVASSFLRSKLTPLLIVSSLGVGLLAVVATPREEEPQISVPMIDVIATLPGGTPRETEQLLVRPVEQQMWEIPGVDHIYSTAGDGMALVTVRFRVGENQDISVAKVQAKASALADAMPPGATQPIVKPHSIDDVPILTLTVHSKRYGSNELRQIAVLLSDELRTIPDVAESRVIGGSPPEMRVTIDPARLTSTGVSSGEVGKALEIARVRLQAGEFPSAGREYLVRVGSPLTSTADVGGVVVAVRGSHPIYVRDVATITEGFAERTSYVTHAAGDSGEASAVTIAVAKRHGANATALSRQLLARVDEAKGRLLPADVSLTVTRDYGETASEKASELIEHLLLATLSVTGLIWLVLGWREALVVLVAVPVTLALTLFAYYAMGYSLNRITLFALIFAIGILVDDAIVVVENMYRHLIVEGNDQEAAALRGVDEVGNPTILATFTVIAAILPMAFVSGLMGPYMRPIPVGASVAMLASLAVAFIVTPYLALRLLSGHVPEPPASENRSVFARFYEKLMCGLMDRPSRRAALYAATFGLLIASVSLVALGAVSVKMLPFDNKSEFQVVLDLPEGTTLEASNALATQVAEYLRTVPDVSSTEVYAGTAAPFNFNGLVRHYFMRRGPNVADIQVNLKRKGERSRQSHQIALSVRDRIDSLAAKYGASAKIAEIPPGPPVLSTLVAEVYGGSDAARLGAANRVRKVFESTPGVVDVDWTVEDPQRQLSFRVDRDRAGAAGVGADQIAAAIYLAEEGYASGLATKLGAPEPEPIVSRLALSDRASSTGVLALPIETPTGVAPLERFVKLDSTTREGARYRKDLRPVIYVTGDVAGRIESPVYGIMAMNRRLDSSSAGLVRIARYNAVAPSRLDEVAMKWDGEWQITIEVFRDLGMAFAVVLVLIYVLVVGWFQSFKVPLVIMAPIPLTLIGILPGHALAGAFFTATSMIGMIALAGIIVRNSILLVDFIESGLAAGRPLRDAVLAAGTVRFRPIALTAAAVVVGGLVMVLDPIFQGLAVALMSGAIVATLLTMVLVPLLYWELRKH